jgi:predicted alpha/beta hydrolase
LAACNGHPGRLTLDELVRVGPTTPSVLVAILRSKRGKDLGSGEIEINVRVAAYCLTALSDADLAHDLAAEIAGLVPHQNWGAGASGVLPALPTVKVKNLHTAAIAAQDVTLWAVTWWQPVRLGADLWEEDGTLPTTVYINQTPEVGEAAIDTYAPVVPADSEGAI